MNPIITKLENVIQEIESTYEKISGNSPAIIVELDAIKNDIITLTKTSGDLAVHLVLLKNLIGA
jgi:hypothetical protein